MTEVPLWRRIAEPLLWFAGLLLIWEALVRGLDISRLFLPAPSEFLWRIVEDYQRLTRHALITLRLILMGFVAGVIPGVILGYLIAKYRLAEQILYPVVIFIQGMPKITLAPLMLVWFGFADFPKVLLTGLITFFPVLVDSVTGFKSIDPRQYYLSRSVGASWWQTFRLFELPSALPHIFAGMRITIVIAVTVVLVVEWLNSKTGLGFLVLRANNAHDMTTIFAILTVASAMGLLLSGFVALLERLAMPWRKKSGAQ